MAEEGLKGRGCCKVFTAPDALKSELVACICPILVSCVECRFHIISHVGEFILIDYQLNNGKMAKH
jgi:hypothetical protein